MKNRKKASERILQVARHCVQSRTALELAMLAAVNFGGMVETYRKRVKELEATGQLKRNGSRRCSQTGRVVKAYEVVR